MTVVSVASVNAANIPDLDGHGEHAMVLDTIRDGNFIFKNTYAEDKQVTISVKDGPLEFYFLNLNFKSTLMCRPLVLAWKKSSNKISKNQRE